MKGQFAELLHAAGFTGSSDPMDQESNKNSSSEKVIETVVAAGLYPKVVSVYKQADKWKAATTKRPPTLRIKDGQKVKIHPTSVNSKVARFETQYLVYQTGVKSTAYFLHECSMVSPLALCLAGGQVRRNKNLLIIDDWIKFRANDDAFSTVKEIRSLLQALLERRLANPNSSDKIFESLPWQFIDIVCNSYKVSG